MARPRCSSNGSRAASWSWCSCQPRAWLCWGCGRCARRSRPPVVTLPLPCAATLPPGPPPAPPLAGHEGPVNSLAIGTLKDRTVLAVGDHTGMVRVWDLNDRRKPLVEVDVGFGVRAVAFGPKSMITVGGSRLLGMQVRRIGDRSKSASRA